MRRALVVAAIIAALAVPAAAFWKGTGTPPGNYVPTYYFLGF
jgi:hypothetical protein